VETKQDKGVKDVEEPSTEASEAEEELEKAGSKEKENREIEKTEEPESPMEAPEEVDEKLEPAAEEILEEEEAVEEEERPEIEKREELEEEIVEERIYTIPLRKAWISPRKKRTPRAVRLVKEFIQRHMKPEALVVSNEVNEKLWSRSIQKPPRRIRVRAARDKEGTVTIYLAEGD
jgi:large subunit ribosomal protein L31e